jgi:phytoene dehydrogenase-like protein
VASAARFDAVVVGAGLNGLAAAVVLARAGKRVLVLEQAEAPGGTARVHEFTPGFRTAPLAPDTGWLSPVVARATGLAIPERVEPAVPFAVLSGAGSLILSRDSAAAAGAMGRYSEADAGRWAAFTELIHKLAGFLAVLYRMPPPDLEASSPGELLRLLRVARAFRRLGRRDMIELLRTVPMSVQELVEDRFRSPLVQAAIGAIGVRGIRQGPRSGGTAFVLLHHQVGAPPGSFGLSGGGYWKAGPGALVDGLAARARALGVEIRCSARVERIAVEDERVTGAVLANGDVVSASLVLSTADPAQTMLSLLDPVWLDPDLLLAVRNIKFRGSTSRISYALSARPAWAGLSGTGPFDGVISLAGSLEEIERAADAAKYGRVSPAPLVVLRLLTDRWTGLAPAGRHVLLAEVQWTPRQLREGDWDAGRRAALAHAVTAAIERVAPGFSGLVQAVETLTPADLESRYGLSDGAPSHGELTLDQILFMRPVPGLSRYRGPLDGLFLAGAGSHPGPGIAGMPGYLAAQAALRASARRG